MNRDFPKSCQWNCKDFICSSLGETLRLLKKLWAHTVLSEDLPSSDLILQTCKNPFAQVHPLSRALSFLLLKKMGALTFPLAPMSPLMPLHELCQLALLWNIAGEEQDSFSLASKLLPLTSLPTLWCKEEEFSEKEISHSLALLRTAFGEERNVPEDPYFLALARHLPKWEYKAPFPHRIVDPGLGFLYQKNDHFTFALTLAGERSPLGSFYTNDVEVRAFGPQLPPFTESHRFGILRLPDSQPMERWTSIAALPEVWMEVHSQLDREECHLTTRFFGQTVEKPIHFSFYIKALHCQIGEEAFYPRTLKRYQGEAKPVSFNQKLKVESLLPGKMQLIPLAGEGGFWGCDFLLTFEVPAFEGRGEYLLAPHRAS